MANGVACNIAGFESYCHRISRAAERALRGLAESREIAWIYDR